MARVLFSFWSFFWLVVLSGGLLGRNLAWLVQGHGGLVLGLVTLPLAVFFIFSFLVLVRIVRLDAKLKSLQQRP
jgi:uncharacterized membrane protein YesL